QFCRARLDDLPDAFRAFNGESIGAGKESQIGDTFQRTRKQIDYQRVTVIETRGRPGVEVRHQHPETGARSEAREQLEAIGRGAAEYSYLARPRDGMRRDEWPMRRQIFAQLRQVEEDRLGSAENHALRQGRGAGLPGRQIIRLPVL